MKSRVTFGALLALVLSLNLACSSPETLPGITHLTPEEEKVKSYCEHLLLAGWESDELRDDVLELRKPYNGTLRVEAFGIVSAVEHAYSDSDAWTREEIEERRPLLLQKISWQCDAWVGLVNGIELGFGEAKVWDYCRKLVYHGSDPDAEDLQEEARQAVLELEPAELTGQMPRVIAWYVRWMDKATLAQEEMKTPPQVISSGDYRSVVIPGPNSLELGAESAIESVGWHVHWLCRDWVEYDLPAWPPRE